MAPRSFRRGILSRLPRVTVLILGALGTSPFALRAKLFLIQVGEFRQGAEDAKQSTHFS